MGARRRTAVRNVRPIKITTRVTPLRGSSRYRLDLVILRVSLLESSAATSTLSTRGVPPVEDHNISVWILYEAHLADAGVLDSEHLGAGGTPVFRVPLD